MTHKFLSDGRKVAVIGKLNNDETIVQEIFVTEDGDEVPSGERFVTRSLHDQPVEPYVDKQIKRKKEHLAEIEAEIEGMEAEKCTIYEKLKGYREILKSVAKFTELVPESELDIFTGVLSGTIEWLVVDGWSITPPIPFSDAVIKMESNRFDSLKLISVFGGSDGNPSYRLSQYKEGVGRWVTISPFSDYPSAVEHIKARAIGMIGREEFGEVDYKTCTNMGIVFDEAHEKLYREKLLKEKINQLERLMDKKRRDEKAVASLEKEVAELSQDNN